ncbi:MAG: acetylglutamate kinase [Eubacteriaceae bacterium]
MIKDNKTIEELKYKFENKTVVIKYGGNAMTNKAAAVSLIDDILFLQSLKIGVVLVHGGGPEINAMLKKTGTESRFVNGLRYTDKETADIVQMVLAGKVNKDLSMLVSQRGGKAVGISGLDSNIIKAVKMDNGVDLGFVGEITQINDEPILDLIKLGYVPILSTVGCDEDGCVYNINADTAAGVVAEKLKAAAFVLLTDIKGILLDKEDESTLINEINSEKANQYINNGIINGGMIPKVKCCMNAAKNGVESAFILDGRKENMLIAGLLNTSGEGTMFVK